MPIDTDLDWEEAYTYRPGTIVELNSQPGECDTIAAYDPMMVPPIWLTHDPRPRYPYELRVIKPSESVIEPDQDDRELTLAATHQKQQRHSYRYPACHLL
ncbi:hypothetical protein ACN4EK_13545 [Pantanalinema rosaneae CENA516]|uniref:hypothetical protein n=1 Tax=Pantanalinema rosaneae TaxID=1620701 RepID=UPI003D6DBEC8